MESLLLVFILLLAKLNECCDIGNEIGDAPFCEKDLSDSCDGESSGEDMSQKAFPSKAVRYIRGRLGNHLSGYMFALTIKLRYKFHMRAP